jgi:prostaglandin E receptor 4
MDVTNYQVTQSTGLFSRFLNNDSVTQNLSTTMADDRTRMDSPCDFGNISGCAEEGLGIRLSTPIIMFTTGILGNILALLVLYTSRKEAKRTVFYTLLAGLAWTDLIGQLMTSPIAIMVYANNRKWVGGKPLCRYHAFAMILFGGLTPLLVCAMSIERLLALKFAYFHARVVTKKKAFIAIAVCWILVMFFCSWPFIGLGSYELQYPKSWCFLNFHKESVSDIIYASIFASTNILIILLNLGCNIAVVVTLLQMRRKRMANSSPYCHRRHGTNQSKTKSIKREAETQMVIFLCAITAVFTTCWLPINVSNQMYFLLFFKIQHKTCKNPEDSNLDEKLFLLLKGHRHSLNALFNLYNANDPRKITYFIYIHLQERYRAQILYHVNKCRVTFWPRVFT